MLSVVSVRAIALTELSKAEKMMNVCFMITAFCFWHKITDICVNGFQQMLKKSCDSDIFSQPAQMGLGYVQE